MAQGRRAFLSRMGKASLGFAGLRHLALDHQTLWAAASVRSGFGDLVRDPAGVLDLPEGFAYSLFSRTGEEMDDGFYVPAEHDGMAAFPGPDGRTILVRNHELSPKKDGEEGSPFGPDGLLAKKVPRRGAYDRGEAGAHCPGGTTTLVYDTKTQTLERHFLSLVGTAMNCAGGATPWGSWITCEETTIRRGDFMNRRDHGYAFEVPAKAEIGLADPIPLIAMGRFNREAVAVDPKSGAVYQTEDTSDGLLYRFLPKEKGNLRKGGRLQALAVVDRPKLDTRNWEGQVRVPPSHPMSVAWVDLKNPTSPNDDLRYQGWGLGAARFARGEGIHYDNGVVYFACTNGGRGEHGQIWKYTPAFAEGSPDEQKRPGQLELFVEAETADVMDRADNLTVAAWGDLIVCEDGADGNYLLGITPNGEVYRLGFNAMNDSEFAGATFSPDRTTLFVNIQDDPGLTVAITGPWPS